VRRPVGPTRTARLRPEPPGFPLRRPFPPADTPRASERAQSEARRARTAWGPARRAHGPSGSDSFIRRCAADARARNARGGVSGAAAPGRMPTDDRAAHVSLMSAETSAIASFVSFSFASCSAVCCARTRTPSRHQTHSAVVKPTATTRSRLGLEGTRGHTATRT
jgi:hypothetical protein